MTTVDERKNNKLITIDNRIVIPVEGRNEKYEK